jgi:hypothetical protein
VADVAAAMSGYESWVDAHVPTRPVARADKHELMARDPFGFFRGSYPLWARRLADLADPPPGPIVDAVGDLHVENFGTWRDAEGRTVWGVNDLDEADRLPAITDLLRLTVSAGLASAHRGLALHRTDVVGLLLDGYLQAVGQGGGPIILDRPDPPALRGLLPEPDPARWWSRLLSGLDTADPGPAVRSLLLGQLPGAATGHRYLLRTAGMGSRDRLRVVVVADVAGGPVAREVKAVPAPATRWSGAHTARLDGPTTGLASVAARILAAGGPARDPQRRIVDGWVARRLAPWCDRVELADLRRPDDAEELLRRMGWETARLHLSTRDLDPGQLRDLATGRPREWLIAAARELSRAVEQDWDAWRRAHRRGRSG